MTIDEMIDHMLSLPTLEEQADYAYALEMQMVRDKNHDWTKLLTHPRFDAWLDDNCGQLVEWSQKRGLVRG